jgi:hypothetical protein
MHGYNHEEYFILFTESNVRIFGRTRKKKGRKKKKKISKQKSLEERQDTAKSKL